MLPLCHAYDPFLCFNRLYLEAICFSFPLEAVTLFCLRILLYPTCVACLGSHMLNLLLVLSALSVLHHFLHSTSIASPP
jgi:hypothetical protein